MLSYNIIKYFDNIHYDNKHYDNEHYESKHYGKHNDKKLLLETFCI